MQIPIAPRDVMPRRTLIAEDDANILTSLEFLLKNDGYTVITSRNGDEAWAALQRDTPDLAVLDVMLPSIDGMELCRRIRATENLRATRVLMLSARGRDSEIQAGMLSGADAYLTKPFGTHEFLETVSRLLHMPQQTASGLTGPRNP